MCACGVGAGTFPAGLARKSGQIGRRTAPATGNVNRSEHKYRNSPGLVRRQRAAPTVAHLEAPDMPEPGLLAG
jgi:hypothetical protein